MPHEVYGEICDLLQSLRGAWPLCKTIVQLDDGKSEGRIDRYIKAVQWLTDRGLVSFEALMVDVRGLSIVHSALTSRGHEYSRSFVPGEAIILPTED